MEGPVTDAERTRFIWYAQHIRTLHLHTARRVDPTVFQHLARARLGSPLAPGLRALYGKRAWSRNDSEDMAVSMLSGPALRTLALAFPQADATVTNDWRLPLNRLPLNRHLYAPRILLADVAASAPGLESLTVYSCAHASLLEPIGAMHSLRKLDLSLVYVTFRMDLLRALARLDQLEELTLSDTFDARGDTPCRGFKGLKKLTIDDGTATVPSLLAALPDLRLRELRLNSFSPLVGHAIGPALCAGPGLSLETLCLKNCHILAHHPSEPVSMLRVLEPFFALQGIRNLILDTDEILLFPDEDLRKIGHAWPNLKVLSLESSASAQGFETPTIEGIIELASVCPGLAGIDFPAVKIQPAVPPTPEGVLELMTVCPDFDYVCSAAIAYQQGVAMEDLVFPLEMKRASGIPLEVWIPDEHIRDVGQVARLLHAAFGTLRIINLEREQHKKWSAVLDEMARLQGQ